MRAEMGHFVVVTDEKPIRGHIPVTRSKEYVARMDPTTFIETERPLSSG